MKLLESFPEALRRLRNGAGLSQRQLAKRSRTQDARITQAMISQWERGTQFPSLESLASFLETLDLTFEDLGTMMGLVESESLEAGDRDGVDLEADLAKALSRAQMSLRRAYVLLAFDQPGHFSNWLKGVAAGLELFARHELWRGARAHGLETDPPVEARE